MCGIYGVLKQSLQKRDVVNFTELAATNVGRGKDSTGVIGVFGSEPKIRALRSIANPVSFFEISNVKEFLQERELDLLVGHNRLATVGEINTNNAQPVHYKHICGVHNGTVKAFEPKKSELHNTTDSKLLFQHLADHGLHSVVKKAGKDGAMALVWVNTQDWTLNFYRNWHRTLWYALSKSGDTMMWSSERGALALQIERDPIIYDTPEPFHMDVLYTISIDKISPIQIQKTPIDVLNEKPKPLTAAEITEKINKKNKENSGGPTLPLLPAPRAPDSSKTTNVVIGRVDTTPIRPGDFYQGYNNNFWSITEVTKKLADSSCSFCTKKPSIFEPIYWMSDEEYACIKHEQEARIVNNNDVHLGRIKRGH